MNQKVKLLDSKEELEEALKIREEVFVKEQGVSVELEHDQYDQSAYHFIIRTDKNIIGTCRLLIENKVGKIGRMAILSKYRKQGLGSRLLDKVIEFSKDKALDALTLNAQLEAKGFYKKNGFEVIDEKAFMEAGIKHLKMNMDLL